MTRKLRSVVSLPVFGALAIWSGLTVLGREDPDPGAYGVLAVGSVFVLAMVPIHRGVIRRRVRWTRGVRTGALGHHAPGMLLPYARGFALVSWFGVMFGLLVGAVLVSLVPQSTVGGYRQEMMPIVGLVVWVGTLWWAVRLLLTGWRRRGLLLNVDGIVFFGTRGRHAAGWEQIAQVEPISGLGEESREGVVVRTIRVAGGSIGSALGDNVAGPHEWLVLRDYLGIDPVLTNQVLNFYLENPAARAELSGPAAIQRLKKADVPAYVQPSVVHAEQQRRWMESR